MKKLITVAGILLVMASNVFADPAILNEPVDAFGAVKKVWEMAEPSGDALWDVDGEFKAGSSMELYSLKEVKLPVVRDLDVRLGWFETQGVYGTLSIDLERATGKEILKYAHVGWYVGADFDKDRDVLTTGPVVGVKAKF